jgi:hypothetical protein
VPGSGPTGATSPFAPQKGQALGQFVAFLACAGQESMVQLGYSPLPPVLVSEDFNAIGRLNGGQQPPPPTAANCKNPYVDGSTPLPGSPVVVGVSGGGIGGTGSTTGTGSTATTGAANTSGGSGAGGSSFGGSGGSGASGGSGSSGSSAASRAAAAAGLTPQLAAEGYTVVNGQIVRKLGQGGPNQYQRAATLVAATDAVANPQAGLYIGWAALVLGAIVLPPLIAMRRSRRRQAAADGFPSVPTDGA